MPVKVKILKPPQGLSRFFFRLPIAVYRMGLGGWLGTRAVLLSHTGRKSGKERQVVLEVVRYDKKTGVCVIAAGFGRDSDWFQNITKEPHIGFTVGSKHRKGTAVRLDENKAGRELVRYEKEHPKAWKELTRFMGYELDGSKDDTRALGKLMPMFTLKPDKD